ncbi:hypothetical protein NA57DRAFT_70318 [Rhizodiscina lignyota]|uniref:Uncharacterized protein n=1 Tax=Rhizodiscina lignyota TaxID=1504668 RepID=A0A9P4IM76_9PEZI|nr:hypothetical protein NA57DRAFT_70318 [Rhizodiscina lignyota]
MDGTTLVTFMYQNPRAYSVELLGSWDNFNQAYPLTRDTRRGGGQWTGCYRFENIILDGDTQPKEGKRTGGLKMGSTYWYYYRVDGGMVETYDEAEPNTTSCPLLPGQCVNVLDVPSDGSVESAPQLSTSSSAAVQTLNPEDRYVNPRPAPRPKLPRLITPVSRGPGTQKIKARLFGDASHPMTAGGWVAERDALSRSSNDERLIKSAAASPSTAVKSAFSFLKGPQSVLTPSDGGRGRSRILRPENRRTERSTSPGERMKISSPTLTYRSDADRQHISLLEAQLAMLGSPAEADEPRQRYAPLRSHPVTLEDRGHLAGRRSRSDDHTHKRQSSDVPISSPKEIPSLLLRSRSVSSSETMARNSLQRVSSSYAHSDPRFPQRSISRRRAPSPLRTSINWDDIEAVQAFNPPTQIQEVDFEDARTPARVDGLASPVQFGKQNIEGGHIPSRSHTKTPSLDKELPPLPSYLIPSPLRVRSAPSEIPASTPEIENYVSNRSHFSIWSTNSAESAEEPEPETGSEGQFSPIFSSVEGGSTGENTPLHIPDREAPKLDDYFPQTEGDEDQQLSSNERPDLIALRELQELIRSPTSTTPDPMAMRRPFTSPLMSRSRELLAMDEGSAFGDLTPTSTAFKQLDLSLLPSDREPVVAVAGESLPEQVAASRQLTQMEELMNEFDYLGGLLS